MRENESRSQHSRGEDRTDRVALLLDADLEPDERQRFLADVAADPELRQHYREIGAAWEMLDAYPAIETSRRSAARILEQARAELQRERQGRLVRMAVGWVAAAGIFLAVFLGLPGVRPGAGEMASNGIETNGAEGDAAAYYYDFEDF